MNYTNTNHVNSSNTNNNQNIPKKNEDDTIGSSNSNNDVYLQKIMQQQQQQQQQQPVIAPAPTPYAQNLFYPHNSQRRIQAQQYSHMIPAGKLISSAIASGALQSSQQQQQRINSKMYSESDNPSEIQNLMLFLATAPNQMTPDPSVPPVELIKRYTLPNNETINCIYWKGLFHITGTDIVKIVLFRLTDHLKRPVFSIKKFEEGVFSDLRNLKPISDATLEEPRSEFLEFLFKNGCIRTQKKQKVFYWFSVRHDQLFEDALERELKREASLNNHSLSSMANQTNHYLQMNNANSMVAQQQQLMMQQQLNNNPGLLQAMSKCNPLMTSFVLPPVGMVPSPNTSISSSESTPHLLFQDFRLNIPLNTTASMEQSNLHNNGLVSAPKEKTNTSTASMLSSGVDFDALEKMFLVPNPALMTHTALAEETSLKHEPLIAPGFEFIPASFQNYDGKNVFINNPEGVLPNDSSDFDSNWVNEALKNEKIGVKLPSLEALKNDSDEYSKSSTTMSSPTVRLRGEFESLSTVEDEIAVNSAIPLKRSKSLADEDKHETGINSKLVSNRTLASESSHIFDQKDPEFSATPPSIVDNFRDTSRKSWRCPACQYRNTESVPIKAYCYCRKEIDPKYNPFLTPFSCGEICERERKTCKHFCPVPCHPGPCPPCQLYTPLKTCFCGVKKFQDKCSESRKEMSCERICSKSLNCGYHKCSLVCHPGPCPECNYSLVQNCNCGKNSRVKTCTNDFIVNDKSEISYSCTQKCEKLLKCGKHFCDKFCHNDDCSICRIIQFKCYCGKAPRENVENDRSCSDLSMESCGKSCDKILDRCGHPCTFPCHSGPCPPCTQKNVSISCGCKSSTVLMDCLDIYYVKQAMIKCGKVCKKPLSCGKHFCKSVCCSDKEHIHNIICNKKLNCGKHFCDKKCHPGNCSRCLQASFDDYYCNCGKTMVFAPLRCNFDPPACFGTCTRPPSCEHLTLAPHNCHESEECPRCTYIVMQNCLCGKFVRNITCYNSKTSVFQCNQSCDLKRNDCMHFCQTVCHSSLYKCESFTCKEKCGKLLKCGHGCSQICSKHGKECDSAEECTESIGIKCNCGRLSKDISCSIFQMSHDSSLLECDQKCLEIQRQKQISHAFYGTDDVKINIEEAPWEQAFTEYVVWFGTKYPKFLSTVENQLETFINRSDLTYLHFSFASSFNKRRFIHELCTNAYNLSTEALDDPPHRTVLVRKTISPLSKCPKIKLSEGIQNGLLTPLSANEYDQLKFSMDEIDDAADLCLEDEFISSKFNAMRMTKIAVDSECKDDAHPLIEVVKSLLNDSEKEALIVQML